MGQFSISDLENLSGIKAHTIRMWEQRYGILRPVRTSTNIRTYCDDDLRRLLNVATLCSRGQRISQVARLTDEELCQAVMQGCDASHNYVSQVNALTEAMLAMDEQALCQQLRVVVQQLGFEQAFMHVVYPFLHRIGIMWQAGTVSTVHEHLVSSFLRQKLMAATDALPPVVPAQARRWALFLPESELHDLALLFMSYCLRARGHHVLYLGHNLPLSELPAVCATYQPHAVCSVLTVVPERDRVQAYFDDLRRLCPAATLLVFYGPLAQQQGLQLPENAVRPRLMTDFTTLVDELRPREVKVARRANVRVGA